MEPTTSPTPEPVFVDVGKTEARPTYLGEL